MSDWLEQYYADVDAMDMDAFLAHHTDDAVVQYANNPPAKGKDQIGQAIGALWGAIGGLRHERVNVWHVEDGAILEAVTHYLTKGGTQVPIPVTSILHRTNGMVDNLRVYIDMAPLFEQIGAEA
jgi:ketosteroid isomerase-like protein